MPSKKLFSRLQRGQGGSRVGGEVIVADAWRKRTAVPVPSRVRLTAQRWRRVQGRFLWAAEFDRLGECGEHDLRSQSVQPRLLRNQTGVNLVAPFSASGGPEGRLFFRLTKAAIDKVSTEGFHSSIELVGNLHGYQPINE